MTAKKLPKLLDLFACAGGASMGYHMAGFDVTGVDIVDHPSYPFERIVSDALTDGRRFRTLRVSERITLTRSAAR